MTLVVGWVVEEVVAGEVGAVAAAYCFRALANSVRKVAMGEGSVLVPVLALDPVSVPDPVPVVPVVWPLLPEVPEEDEAEAEAEALSPSSLW